MRLLLTLAFSILLLGSLQAQEKLDLSFKDAVKIGLDNNVSLKQNVNTLSSVQATKLAGLGSLGPRLSASATGWINDGNFFIEQEARVVNSRSENMFGSLDANILIFNGLSQLNTIRGNEHRLNAQISSIRWTEQQVISDVALQYLLVLQDNEQVLIAQENLETQQILLDQITAMFEAGSSAITDMYDQEYQVKNSELQLIRASHVLRNDMAILLQTLGLNPSDSLILQQPSWNVEDISLSDYNVEQMYQTAVQNRSDLKMMEQNEMAAKRDIATTKGIYFPRLSGFFSWSSRFTDQTSRTFDEQFLSDNTRTQYGLQLSIPIYSGLNNRAQVVGSKVAFENARLDSDYQELIVKSDVLRAYQNFLDVYQAYEASLVQFKAAEKSYETQRESYEVGVSSLIELSNANQVFVDAQTTLTQATYGLLFQKILLDFSIGTLDFDQIPD